MPLSEETIKLLFGLKLKAMRKEKNLSLSALAKDAGLSVSYINEIEKGKKYPKQDKILALAASLETTYDQLISTEVTRSIQPLADVLKSDLFQAIPLETFGISPENIIQLMSEAPARVHAFIAAMLEMARHYNMQQEHFYFTALRMLQEMQNNFFPSIEETAEAFRAEHLSHQRGMVKTEWLAHHLENTYNYTLKSTSFSDYPNLQNLRSIYKNGKTNTLYYNTKLSGQQRAFLFGKELGFLLLGLKERPITSSWLEVQDFNHVFNNFKASYFSCALLIPAKPFVGQLQAIFSSTTWNPSSIAQLMESYGASPEMFMHRLTNVLPQYFGLHQLFFIRYSDGEKHDRSITKELHLSAKQRPVGQDMDEINYRRWMTGRVVGFLERRRKETDGKRLLINAVRSRFTEGGHEYFCLSINRPRLFVPGGDAVTIGFVIDDKVREQVKFLNDPSVFELTPDEDYLRQIMDPEQIEKQKSLERNKEALHSFLDSTD